MICAPDNNGSGDVNGNNGRQRGDGDSNRLNSLHQLLANWPPKIEQGTSDRAHAEYAPIEEELIAMARYWIEQVSIIHVLYLDGCANDLAEAVELNARKRLEKLQVLLGEQVIKALIVEDRKRAGLPI